MKTAALSQLFSDSSVGIPGSSGGGHWRHKFVVALLLFYLPPLLACGGGYFPDCYLSLGDTPMLWAPTANFANELGRIKLPKLPFHFRESELSGPEQSVAADRAELRAALLKKENKQDREKIFQAYIEQREVLLAHQSAFQKPPDDPSGEAESAAWLVENLAPPLGLPQEFADYFSASLEWNLGKTNEARRHWESLLGLPKAQRPFRSTWAAFMLGKSWLKEDDGKALRYFEQVRQFATNHFADSLNLAASTYGWEGRAELNRTNYSRAVEHYIEALAAGDPTATISLQWTIAAALEHDPSSLVPLATNKLAQRVVTAHLISRFWNWKLSQQFEPVGSRSREDEKEARETPAGIWLKAIEEADAKDVELAEQLALAFYQAGQMEKAQRWILRAPGKSLIAQWLQAKLFLRNGDAARAAKLLSKLAAAFPLERQADSPPATLTENVSMEFGDRSQRPIEDQLWSELGILKLTRREYTEALDILLRHGFEQDAAYVAERVLTREELRGYVDRNFPVIPKENEETEREPSGRNESDHGVNNAFYRADPAEGRCSTVRQQSIFIRELLGRRLMRAFLFEDAKPYLPELTQPTMDRFVTLWDTGFDTQLPPRERAIAFWNAAHLVQTNGFELFGSVTEPWWSYWGGFYHFEDSSLTRLTNSQTKLVPPSSDELRRAIQHAPDRRRRFNYHYWAADLAWNAAVLMPNNSDQTAEMLHTAGSWIKVLDHYEADRFYKTLVRRCRRTALGDAADRKRWFLTQSAITAMYQPVEFSDPGGPDPVGEPPP